MGRSEKGEQVRIPAFTYIIHSFRGLKLLSAGTYLFGYFHLNISVFAIATTFVCCYGEISAF